MNDTFGSAINNVYKALGGVDSNYYIYCADRTAAGEHPTIEESAAYADKITALLKTIMNGTYEAPSGESSLGENAAYVDPSLSSKTAGEKVTATINGTQYELTVGLDAFSSLTAAHNALSAGGTMYLAAGTYTETFSIQKDMTILGPKAGINPNTAAEGSSYIMNLTEGRGTGEAIITANWGIGVMNGNVYDAKNITIDGITLSGAALFRQNCGLAGECKITLRNFLVRDITTTNNMMYFYPYYPTGNANAYIRDVVFENFRIEGLSTKVFCNLFCRSFEASGIYMDENCRVSFTDCIGVNTVSKEFTVTIRDSIFRNRNTSALIFNTRTDASTFSTAVASADKITLTVENCTFAPVINSTAVNPSLILLKINTENVFVNITGNKFIGISGYPCTAVGNSGSAALDFSSKITLSGNTFTDITTETSIK